MIASSGKHSDCIRAILDAARDAVVLKDVLEEQNGVGKTALYFAVCKHDLKSVEHLVAAAEEVNLLKKMLVVEIDCNNLSVLSYTVGWYPYGDSDQIAALLLKKAEDLGILSTILRHRANGCKSTNAGVIDEYSGRLGHLLGNYYEKLHVED